MKLKRLRMISFHILSWSFVFFLMACNSQPAPTAARQLAQATQIVQACGTPVPLHASRISECWDQLVTDTPTATATATSTPTVTPSPVPSATSTATASATTAPSATAAPTSAIVLVPWHAPGSHLDPITHLPLGIHEHGDPPPDWVLASGHTPFNQVRESHVGYKGAYAPIDVGGKGVEAYLITHILSTSAARAHGDHDFQLWVRTPGTGAVSYWSGLLDFGTPPITRTVDTGERPIILSRGDNGTSPANSNCETWYGRPGSLVFDLGWTICNRYQNFAGTVLGGNGTYRGTDWQIYVSRLSEFPGGDPALANFCTDDGFGHCRIGWLVTGHDYPGADVVKPVN